MGLDEVGPSSAPIASIEVWANPAPASSSTDAERRHGSALNHARRKYLASLCRDPLEDAAGLSLANSIAVGDEWNASLG
jgi:hypothetical protein